MQLTSYLLLAQAATIAFAQSTTTAPLYEPADGKLIFGGWIDTEDPNTLSTNIGIGGDSPNLFNQRLGHQAGVFHFSQMLPLEISSFTQQQMTVNLTAVEDTGTDAILFMTVYPDFNAQNPYDLYTDADILMLAHQLDNMTNPTKSARRVMMRFAPEMNGNWFTYGQQPQRFVAEYQRIVNVIRTVTNRVSFVWAPNAANLYPFGTPLPTAEITNLDTNKNGILDFGDDPFTPYWPGSAYVDWVGISLYWKGNPNSGTPPHDNSACPATYWTDMVQGGGLYGSNASFPFYTMFAQGYNKPLVMPEGGAAYALYQTPSTTLLPPGAGQTVIAQTFWRSYLNTAFFAQFPKAKMFINFEYQKINEDPMNHATNNNGITRDYRITWNPPTLAALQADLAGFSTRFQWAVKFVAGVDPLTIGGGQTPQPSTVVTSTTGGASVATSTKGGVTATPTTTSGGVWRVGGGWVAVGVAVVVGSWVI
ncbi:hypothetical protein HDU98_007605 [Podochytrium sp. JEL0797]|nr:hypothetical protein HDU98_007605 [Podochytrium sp. JEL0797]